MKVAERHGAVRSGNNNARSTPGKSLPTMWLALALAAVSATPMATMACNGAGADMPASVRMGALKILNNDQPNAFVTRVAMLSTDKDNRAIAPSVQGEFNAAEGASAPGGTVGGNMIYLEPAGGRWRTCREERWQSRRGAPAMHERHAAKPVDDVAEVLADHLFLGVVRTYRYDPAGHLVEARDIASPDARALLDDDRLSPTSALVFCARYDDAGRLLWSTDTDAAERLKPERRCDSLSEENVDSLRVLYNPDASVLALLRSRPSTLPEGSSVALMMPDGYDNAGWSGTATYLMPPRAGVDPARNTVTARIAQGRGIASLQAYSADFAADDIQVPYQERPQPARTYGPQVYYDFPDADLPLLSGQDGFAQLARYRRVRSYGYGQNLYVEELFEAGSHQLRQRIWRDQLLLRQEDYDTKGRLQQVISAGAGVPHLADEDLAGAAQRAGFKQPLLSNSHAAYRVYRYDRNGRARLQLACWFGVGSAVNAGAEVRCGGPDGQAVAVGDRDIDALLYGTYGLSNRRLAHRGY